MNMLKRTAIILIIILICFISFIGIYQKKLNKMENIIPEYLLGMEYGEKRVVRLDVDLGTKTIYYDENGNEIEHIHEDGEDEESIISEEVLVNKEEAKTKENFEKTKSILKKRLKDMGAGEYHIRQDDGGNFAIELLEDDYTDAYIQVLATKGTFLIADSTTGERLLGNNNIKNAQMVTYQDETGYVTAYLVVNFDEEGTKKLEEISNTYIEQTDEEGNTTTKNVLIMLDGQTLLNTYFGQTMSTGELQIPIGEETNSGEELAAYMLQGQQIATVLRHGELPLTYEIGYNNTLSSSFTENNIQVAIIAIAIIIAMMVIYLILIYKVKGILAAFTWIGFIAVLLLALRYANCIFTPSCIVAIAIVSIWEFIFVNALIRNKEDKEFIKLLVHYAIIAIPMYIISIVATFDTAIAINSFGTALFWGNTLMVLYNLIVANNLICEK